MRARLLWAGKDEPLSYIRRAVDAAAAVGWVDEAPFQDAASCNAPEREPLPYNVVVVRVATRSSLI